MYQKLRVLIIDHQASFDHVLATNIRCWGYDAVVLSPLVAGWRSEAEGDVLLAVLRLGPHCIVTDLILPLMNGYQIMRCLAASSLRAWPTFVVVSALTQLERPMNRSYLQGKVVEYVNKPLSFDDLLTSIEHVRVGMSSSKKGT